MFIAFKLFRGPVLIPAISISLAVMWFFSFIVILLFPYLNRILGGFTPLCFIIFCLCGIPFGWFCVDEGQKMEIYTINDIGDALLIEDSDHRYYVSKNLPKSYFH